MRLTPTTQSRELRSSVSEGRGASVFSYPMHASSRYASLGVLHKGLCEKTVDSTETLNEEYRQVVDVFELLTHSTTEQKNLTNPTCISYVLPCKPTSYLLCFCLPLIHQRVDHTSSVGQSFNLVSKSTCILSKRLEPAIEQFVACAEDQVHMQKYRRKMFVLGPPSEPQQSRENHKETKSSSSSPSRTSRATR